MNLSLGWQRIARGGDFSGYVEIYGYHVEAEASSFFARHRSDLYQ